MDLRPRPVPRELIVQEVVLADKRTKELEYIDLLLNQSRVADGDRPPVLPEFPPQLGRHESREDRRLLKDVPIPFHLGIILQNLVFDLL